MTGAVTTAKIVDFRITYIWSKHPVSVLNGFTTVAMEKQYADELRASEEDEVSLDENNILHLMHWKVQKMADSTMVKCKENMLKRVKDVLIRQNVKNLFKSAAEEATKNLQPYVRSYGRYC